MANIIHAGGANTELKLIGSYTGNQTIDVSSVYSDGDTADNYLVVPTSVQWEAKQEHTTSDMNNGGTWSGNVSKSLDQRTKKLTVSGMYGYGKGGYIWGWYKITYNVYRIDQ